MSHQSPWLSRRTLLAGAGAVALAGCGDRKQPEPAVQAAAAPQPAQDGPPEGSLEWSVAGPWRASDRVRDRWRHPVETLKFFGLDADQTVLELWPGAGYWTEIVAPFLARNRGRYYAAQFALGQDVDPALAQTVARFREHFGGDRTLYGDVNVTEFPPAADKAAAPAATVDLVLMMSNLHTWMAAGMAEVAFREAFAALKPGGVLGVEQHREPLGDVQDPAATSGYVQEMYVKQLAAEAGFIFAASSEINANPKDTRDHPFGVWTLPPTRLSAPRGQPENPNFDHAKYDLIGESDRMTLKFRKPA
ncbi:MAG TPA: methyltransferase [Caulobacteraceae bacterium]|nr:methyltransferase [Caulobacteraceae bacterium]